ncbi:MAG: hypothetical protein WCB04_03790 [Mycobacteriales bacterium]
MSVIWEVLGWAGAGALLVAYALLSAGRLPANRAYHAINVTGSVGLGLNAWVHRALPGLLVNIVWLLIGLVSIVEANRRRRAVTDSGAPDQNG